MVENKFIVVTTSQIEQALRIPATWVQKMNLKDAEESAKELASRHGKRYTVMKVVSSFSPDYTVVKEK